VLDIRASKSGHRRMILKVMRLPELRPMTPTDVDAAAELILGNDWGVRREWLEFATTQPACIPFVADADGEIVGTGVGTANGAVGWIGTIFIAPDRRGQGVGRAITQAIMDRLESAGCRSLVLVATTEGRPLYERMGFELQTRYHILQAIGLPPVDEPDGVREFEPRDLPAIVQLDRAGTGEDRAHAIRRLAQPGTARVVEGDDGAIEGFVIRAPWGGGATIAHTPDAALRILTARRRAAGPEGRIRVGLLDENTDGLARLAEVGLRLTWSAPRMLRGESLSWHPDWIWGQFNHAMG
jgi:GNAT superfamily N-acetyltransferase